MHPTLRTILYIVFFFTTSLIATIFFMEYCGIQSRTQTPQRLKHNNQSFYVVVPGGNMNRGDLGDSFRDRVRRGIHLCSSFRNDLCQGMIFTGGKGEGLMAMKFAEYLSGPHADLFFPQVMTLNRTATQDRVPMYHESRSLTTWENAMFILEDINTTTTNLFNVERNVSTLVVVTDTYHSIRAVAIFRRVFPTTLSILGYGSRTTCPMMWLYMSLREVGACLKGLGVFSFWRTSSSTTAPTLTMRELRMAATSLLNVGGQ
eukprot:PhF_6_TR19718/c0_g1_i2/m.28784